MTTKSIRVLVKFTFASTVVRIWDGAGPYLDANGDVWAGAVINDGLDDIEMAINGEAATLTLGLSGIDPEIANMAYEELDDAIGAKVQLLIQPCDEWDQPVGDPKVKFTGTIDNMMIEDQAQSDAVTSTIIAEVTNRFDLRTLINGAVLSDVDQQARSAIINPGADADRFAERIPGLSDKSIVWPRFS